MNIRHILSAAVLLLVSQTVGGKGFYLNPNIGMGSAGVYGTGFGSVSNFAHKSAPSLSVPVGYEYRNMRFGTGIAIQNVGYTNTNLVFASEFDPFTGQPINPQPYTFTYSAWQLYMPLSFGYTFRPSKKISIIPELCFGPAYTMVETVKITSQNGGEMSQTSVPQNANTFTMFGMAAVNLVYNLKPNLGISFGPSYKREVNNVLATTSNTSFFRMGFNVISINAGVLISIPAKPSNNIP